MSAIDASRLHRGAKYFMDNGRAQTHDEAMALLRQFGLTVHVGTQIATSREQQLALLTLVNLARRTFLAGVEVIGLPQAAVIAPIAAGQSLERAVIGYGGRIAKQPNSTWPSAGIGNAVLPATTLPCWRLTWEGWRGGVIPARENRRLTERGALTLAPLLAAAACAAEVFAFHAQDHAMAGRRAYGCSLWNPGADWRAVDATEPQLCWLPACLWIIGLGNLGQACAWALASLPYPKGSDVRLVLQDYDRIAPSNDSTSMLSFLKDVGQRKTRVVGGWLDVVGFDTYLIESAFGPWTRRSEREPPVAFCGVDNALARTALDGAGFDLVVEAGLGAGPQSFRSMSLHTFPGSRSPAEIWSKHIGAPDEDVESMPAYQALKHNGVDTCGLAQLATRTVGVPFVGLTAALFSVAELLRRLHRGPALELLSASLLCLDTIEAVQGERKPYAYGHVDAPHADAA
jgi:hypothetical protein